MYLGEAKFRGEGIFPEEFRTFAKFVHGTMKRNQKNNGVPKTYFKDRNAKKGNGYYKEAGHVVNTLYTCQKFKACVKEIKRQLSKLSKKDTSIKKRKLIERRGMCHLWLGNNKKALRDLDWTISFEQKVSKAFWYRAIAIHNLGKDDEARESFEMIFQSTEKTLIHELFIQSQICFERFQYHGGHDDLCSYLDQLTKTRGNSAPQEFPAGKFPKPKSPKTRKKRKTKEELKKLRLAKEEENREAKKTSKEKKEKKRKLLKRREVEEMKKIAKIEKIDSTKKNKIVEEEMIVGHCVHGVCMCELMNPKREIRRGQVVKKVRCSEKNSCRLQMHLSCWKSWAKKNKDSSGRFVKCPTPDCCGMIAISETKCSQVKKKKEVFVSRKKKVSKKEKKRMKREERKQKKKEMISR